MAKLESSFKNMLLSLGGISLDERTPMSATARRTPITLPAGHPCATFFLDESSSRASGGSFFVIGGIQAEATRTIAPGTAKRYATSSPARREFKFNTITKRAAGHLLPGRGRACCFRCSARRNGCGHSQRRQPLRVGRR